MPSTTSGLSKIVLCKISKLHIVQASIIKLWNCDLLLNSQSTLNWSNFKPVFCFVFVKRFFFVHFYKKQGTREATAQRNERITTNSKRSLKTQRDGCSVRNQMLCGVGLSTDYVHILTVINSSVPLRPATSYWEDDGIHFCAWFK